MNHMVDWLKVAAAALGGAAAYLFGPWDAMILALVCVVAIDYITGVKEGIHLRARGACNGDRPDDPGSKSGHPCGGNRVLCGQRRNQHSGKCRRDRLADAGRAAHGPEKTLRNGRKEGNGRLTSCAAPGKSIIMALSETQREERHAHDTKHRK